jgi:imidazolonepropionase-like amidohydrolase
MGCARYGETIGSLEAGKGADMVLIDWDQVAYPYLDELTPTLDAVVQRITRPKVAKLEPVGAHCQN